MQLQLVFEDQWSVSVWVGARLEEALGRQRARAQGEELEGIFAERIATCIANALEGSLDSDLQVPSENQVRYATDIAKELVLPLPAEALQFRGAAHDFIARFDPAFRQSRENRRRAKSTNKE